ncbi:hypothetical protein EV644_10399 [Kribbella orskensis]|uniref:Uncharacterized protein n=1 Tax=Kribbella orskensis TaxID=2512216 RepID=A0ABY2BS95_9ACTN|nr:hypothetical protein EV642_106321 [Kribbella sp. VKM Ac-2500]TCO27402.1 hypothetical protein EV644_10399 [Kribbella orskensis]
MRHHNCRLTDTAQTQRSRIFFVVGKVDSLASPMPKQRRQSVDIVNKYGFSRDKADLPDPIRPAPVKVIQEMLRGDHLSRFR